MKLEYLSGPNHQAVIRTGTECGDLYLSKFSTHFPDGRPWHIVGMGTFHETAEAALEFMTAKAEPRAPSVTGTYTGYGFNWFAPSGN